MKFIKRQHNVPLGFCFVFYLEEMYVGPGVGFTLELLFLPGGSPRQGGRDAEASSSASLLRHGAL